MAFCKDIPGKNPAWYLFYSQGALYFMLSFFTTWYSNPTTWFYFVVTGAFGIFFRDLNTTDGGDSYDIRKNETIYG